MKESNSLGGLLKLNPLAVFAALFCAGAAVGVYTVCRIPSDELAVVGTELSLYPGFMRSFVRSAVQYAVILGSLLICANLTFGWLASFALIFLCGVWHAAGCAGALIAAGEDTALVCGLIASFIVRSVGYTVAILAAVDCTAISCAVFLGAFDLNIAKKNVHIKKRYIRVAVYSVFLTAAAAADSGLTALIYYLLR